VTLAVDPERQDGRVLLDAAGREVARFQEAQRDGRRVADLFELSVPAADALATVLADLAGWRVSAVEDFGRVLVDAGGRPRRHGHVLSRDLTRDPAPPEWLDPPVPAGLRLTPVDRPALDLARACFAAYPRDHPDYDHIPSPEHPEIELEEIVSGRLMGRLLDCSGLAVHEGGAVVGAILVNLTDGEPPTGGPWVSQLFRDPDVPGIGGPLLRRALAVATRDGLPALGLAVTEGNPARRLYEAHGFAAVLSSLTVELPEARGPRLREAPEARS
jgi:GNAT superfamily N-acetyltransferase